MTEHIELKRRTDADLREILAQLQVLSSQGFRKQCPDHQELADDVRETKDAVNFVRSEVKVVGEKVDGLRLSSYGPDGLGGTVGAVNWLKGGMVVVCALLTFIAYTSWNTSRDTADHSKQMAILQTQTIGIKQVVDEHALEPAHDVMEKRYETIINRINKEHGNEDTE